MRARLAQSPVRTGRAVPEARAAPEVWWGRVRCRRDPFGWPCPGTPRQGAADPDRLRKVRRSPRTLVRSPERRSTGRDRPAPRRIGDTRYRIAPITMIENTLIRRSTRTMVVASWAGSP